MVRRPQYSAREFLAFLCLMFLVSPFIEGTGNPRLYWSLLMTGVLVSGGIAAGDQRSTRIWALAAAAPGLVLMWFHHLVPERLSVRYAHGLIFFFATWVSFRLLRHVLQAKKVNANLLCAAVATYLMVALAWGLVYIVIGDVDPQAFAWAAGPAPSHTMKGFTALYFSIATISTVAYGDIMPLSPLARLLAMVEAVGGMLYMTLLVARLVSAYSSERSSGNDG